MQSTFSTCGPSSAATILRAIGRRSSEQELARECYTYRGGTENWYLARALRRRGLKAAFIVQPPERAELPHPAIAGVVLSGGSIVGGGAGHFVAVLDQTGDTVTIADPLKGKLILKRSEIGKHYRLTGFFLMVRMR